MWKQYAATVILAMATSVVVTLVVERPVKGKAGDTLRAKKIELIDDNGKVRGALELTPWEYGPKKMEPRLVLMDDQGNPSATLYLNMRGEGSLSFSSYQPENFREGILQVGYLQTDDSGALKDPLGAWGVRVEDSKRTTTAMGLRNSGAPLGLSAVPAPAPTTKELQGVSRSTK